MYCARYTIIMTRGYVNTDKDTGDEDTSVLPVHQGRFAPTFF